MEILYNYKPYDHPKECIYYVTGEKYSLPEGWEKIKTKATVIGETELWFITRLMPTTLNHPPHTKVVLPIGFHKSRLIKWLPTQLSLF